MEKERPMFCPICDKKGVERKLVFIANRFVTTILCFFIWFFEGMTKTISIQQTVWKKVPSQWLHVVFLTNAHSMKIYTCWRLMLINHPIIFRYMIQRKRSKNGLKMKDTKVWCWSKKSVHNVFTKFLDSGSFSSIEEEKPILKDAQDFVKRTYLPNLVIVYADGNCLHRCAASHFELDENLYKLVRLTHLDPFFTNQIEAEKGSHSFLWIFFTSLSHVQRIRWYLGLLRVDFQPLENSKKSTWKMELTPNLGIQCFYLLYVFKLVI